MATPEMIWLPLRVIEAMPCSIAMPMETRMPAMSPSHILPVIAATLAAPKAAPSILPSSPMSKMPERSE